MWVLQVALCSVVAPVEGNRVAAWDAEAPHALRGLTTQQLAAAVTHKDQSGRLHRVLERLLNGEGLEFAVVGGSVSAGSTLGIHRREGLFLWHGRFLQWLNASFPDAAHRRINGAVPASTPAYVEGCLSFHVPATAQLIFVEYSVNTPEPREYERLLRRLLSYPSHPPVIMLHMFKWWPKTKMRGFDYTKAFVDASDLDFPYAAPIEEAATQMAKWYEGVSSVSMRASLFDVVRANGTDGLRLRDLMLDRIHPSDTGQLVAAQLIASFFDTELAKLRAKRNAWRPTALPPSATLHHAGTLRAPYFRNNADDQFSNTVVCVRGQDMLRHTVRMEGWRYVIEGSPGNPKPGIRADAQDSQLDLCWHPAARDFDRAVSFKLGYLKTYNEEFGAARLSCSGICRCAVTDLSGLASGRPKRINGRDRTSLHHVENVVLHPLARGGGRGAANTTSGFTVAHLKSPRARRRALANTGSIRRVTDVMRENNTQTWPSWQVNGSWAGSATVNASCCIVSIRTLAREYRQVRASPSGSRHGSSSKRAARSPVHAASFKVLSFFVGKGAAGTGRLHQQSIVLAGTT